MNAFLSNLSLRFWRSLRRIASAGTVFFVTGQSLFASSFSVETSPFHLKTAVEQPFRVPVGETQPIAFSTEWDGSTAENVRIHEIGPSGDQTSIISLSNGKSQGQIGWTPSSPGAYTLVHETDTTRSVRFLVGSPDSSLSASETFYVDAATGSDRNVGLSWSKAKASIQAAIDVACPGDTILVERGVYEPIVVSKVADLSIVGIRGANETVIDGSLQWQRGVTNRCATLGSASSTNVVLTGFCLTNGIAETGGGAYYGILSHCIIRGNVAKEGGGAYGGKLYSCIVSGNVARSPSAVNELDDLSGFGSGSSSGSGSSGLGKIGLAVEPESSLELISVFGPSNCGGGAYKSDLFNCLLYSNTASVGGGAYGGSVVNSTIVNNQGAGYSGSHGHSIPIGFGSVKDEVRNCIIVGNTLSESLVPVYNDLMLSVEYTTLDQEVSGTGNMVADPRFVATDNNDFRLRQDSPCIDAGSNEFVTTTEDLVENRRIAGSAVDMGAFEYGSSPQNRVVTLDPQSGSGGTASVTATYGSAMPSITVPTRTGYTFGGYYTSTGGGGTQYYTASGASARTWDGTVTTLYAKWTANTYTITLNRQNGSGGTASVTATYGSAMPSITIPTRTGYTFGGYYTSTGGGGTQYYTASGASARNWDETVATTLYAKWTANTYTITLNRQNGSGGTASVTATYGSAMPAITVPTREGYTFGGYYTSTGGGGTQYYTASGASARNWDETVATTLYAKWTITPSSNDDFANASVISGKSGSATGTTVGATREDGDPVPSAQSSVGGTIWWRWAAPASGMARFSTEGSSFDTVLAVYTGTALTALSEIASNDDGGTNRTSIVSFLASSGTTYWISVAGFGSSTGAVNLTWSETAFKYETVNGKATVTGMDGSFSGALVIPETLGGCPVTGIANNCFNAAWKGVRITSIVLPDSLESIGEFAFRQNPLESVHIPSGVTSIAGNAFRNCDGLAGISVDPANRTFRGIDGVLFSKDGKTLVLCPEGRSGRYSVPDGVKAISDMAFVSCERLSAVTLPSSLQTIGEEAFDYCLGLTEITIPANVSEIGVGAFQECYGLLAISVDEGNEAFCGVDGVLLSKDGRWLMACPGGKSGAYAIPVGVRAIDQNAFVGCRQLTSVAVPRTVSYICGTAFYGCGGLASITMSDGLSTIGEGAFYGCTGLSSLTIPASVIFIGDYAFLGCNSLERLALPSAFEGRTDGMGIPEGCEVVFDSFEPVDVHRFYSKAYRGHFFTISEAEKDDLVDHNPNWKYEGTAYRAFKTQASGTVPLFRFYSKGYRGHFFTIDAEEAETVKANRNWKYEGIAYYVYPEKVEGTVPVFRFWSKGYRHHFYTTNEAEKEELRLYNPNWEYEGIAFYALSAEATGQGRAVASGAPEGGAFGERALPEAEGDVLDGGTPGGRALQETGGVVIRGAGVFPMGAWTIEVREEAPDAEEISAGPDEPPAQSALPSIRVALPEGAAAVSLWSASAGPVSENANPGPKAEFIPEAVGTWHWLRAEDEKGKNVLSLWIRLLP